MTAEDPLEFALVPSQIGTFRIVYRGRRVRSVDLLERGLRVPPLPDGASERRPPFASGTPPRQLSEYFRGKRAAFDFDFDEVILSAFDRDVYRELLKVPAGRTVTYAELARRSGHPGTARAVGGAMHRNALPILVPCHRVVGSEGSLTGFGLGLWRKRWLLDREGAWPLRSGTPEGPRDPRQLTLGPSVDGSHADGIRSVALRRHGNGTSLASGRGGERAA
jgi:methylated-DNA-[protein]-cysteine S-methyltransferase